VADDVKLTAVNLDGIPGSGRSFPVAIPSAF
jgi:hypothetical protein